MEEQLKEFKKYLKPFQSTLVLDCFTVVRLVDVVFDEDDFYWVFDGSKGIYLSSCVGMWTSLKDKFNEKEYGKLVRSWNLNHKEKAI